MEKNHASHLEIQDSLSPLKLHPRAELLDSSEDRILLGKVLATRSFRRFTVTEIVQKTWRLKTKVHIEKLSDNVFKFLFGCKEYKEKIFRGRPWSLNGAHLILKEWSSELSINEVSFELSTFTIQIRGLPPVIIHEGTAERIGNKIGVVPRGAITKRSIVVHRYLIFKVDIYTNKPLPPGFFYAKNNGDEIWIQFKYERLGDFYYRCGWLSHVTGRCQYENPATVSTVNGIMTKVYGAWLRADES